MSRNVIIFLLVFLPAFGLQVSAQQKKVNNAHVLRPNIYLGDYKGGVVGKNQLRDLLKNGFTAHDSLGNKYKIVGFDFTFAEHNLYEDEAGNPQVMIDYSNEYCPGDTVTSNISENIYQRFKAGDTVFIDHVQLQKYPENSLLSPTDTEIIAGKGMKCVIVK